MRRNIANARIDMRTSTQTKDFLELAAYIGGYGSLSKFIIDASQKMAQEIFEHTDFRKISNKDRDLLLKILQNPPEPNEMLKETYQKLSSSFRISEDGQAVYEIDEKFIKK